MENDRPPASMLEPPANHRPRWPWLFAAGGLLIILLALILPRKEKELTGSPGSTNSLSQTASARFAGADGRGGLHRSSASGPGQSAEQIVADKLSRFAHGRRAILLVMAKKLELDVPAEVERFFE